MFQLRRIISNKKKRKNKTVGELIKKNENIFKINIINIKLNDMFQIHPASDFKRFFDLKKDKSLFVYCVTEKRDTILVGGTSQNYIYPHFILEPNTVLLLVVIASDTGEAHEIIKENYKKINIVV